ncbi:ABC transporter ATP-binding protein [Corynebacterium macclintockiae]|uniref:ABC transporter ATP-binding protein n=1 Tax=Corynebacterium TaxID=1716 RepID=UPI0005540B92|nr:MULTISPECIES: ATP-binding cassette domain-containing protein [Corynebacterium]MBC6794696.1 hypothetical protein [Corynebacterium sp. LK28]MDK8870236.1 ATP-binding cassette domain-containing protein [Corynebacterium macclintockiae]MDK8891634.1 ATP-binding cassette domain-containing protein [Corynebacterium macclintockiae]OFM59871.1 hypothetical protein HMPREF2678_05160 [Corynebacterium sp. HMSC058E07]
MQLLTDCTIGRSSTPLASGLNLVVTPGKVYRVTGANGIGKSTLADTIVGFIRPLEGSRNACLPLPGTRAHQHLFGYLPSRVSPLPSLNFQQWCRAISTGYGIQEQQVESLWQRLGGRATQRSRLDQLSSGNLRKAFALNAFAIPRKILILDEPFEELDSHGRKTIAELITEQARAGAAVLAISHTDFSPKDHILELTEDGLQELFQ